jgi:hypothetical protein
MTICAAIRCADGIVLAADREIGRGETKYCETKLFTVNNSPEWSVTFGYAGHPDFAKKIYNKLLSFSAKLQTPEIEAIKDAIGYYVGETYDEFPQESDLMEMAFAVQCKGKVSLFKTEDRSVAGEINRRAFLGAGDAPVVRYLERVCGRLPLLTCHGLPLAIYIVKQAKEFVKGCGGETDAVVIKANENPAWTAQPRIKHIEKCARAFEVAVGTLVYSLTGADSTDEEFAGNFATFRDEILNIRLGKPSEYNFPFENY